MAFCPKKFNSTETSNINICLLNSTCTFKDYLLPTITLDFILGGKIKCVRCLLDTGSQRSYLSSFMANQFDCTSFENNCVELNLQTFLGKQTKKFNQQMFTLKFVDNHF